MNLFPQDVTGLAESESLCRKIARSHYENFLVASVLLPKNMRQPFYNIYAFCRTADDIADEPLGKNAKYNPQTALTKLDEFQSQLDATFDENPPGGIFPALADTVKKFSIDKQLFDDLLNAFRQDQSVTRYATTDQLLDYCTRSANPVGRIVLKLADSLNDTTAELSDEICTGLQLVNFWQDVARDFQIGRIYVPSDEMKRFNVTPEMFEKHSTPRPLRHCLAALCDQAESHFERGLPLASKVPKWLASDVRLFAHGGLATISAIRKIDFDVLRVRPTVSKTRQLWLVSRAALGWLNDQNASCHVGYHAPMSSSQPSVNFRHVRRISRRSGSNFYRSFWLLPKSKRDAMCALYAFSRVTDDLGDCDHPTAQRTQWLLWWKETTTLNLESRPTEKLPRLANNDFDFASTAPFDLKRMAKEIQPALRQVVDQFQIPPRYLLEIIDGVVADQQKTRFDTYEQLEHYCYLVASAVGLACLHIWGFRGELPLEAAIDCGLAFQLTNILRDISEDARRGRIYLPRQHYEQHGLGEDDLLTPRPDDRLRCLIEDEVKRAEKLYQSGWSVWDSLDADGRPMFSMMWRTYRRLLDRIAEDPRAVATKRIQLSAGEKLGLVSRHFLSPIFRRLPVPPVEVAGQS